ncbi:diiron oxygenase [Actinomadura rubrisoli]|uniref:diiron oxygenase n=1 Tax=Actinomadura rubrisoli TaxID=2530368 RepID=UPI001A9CD824|nr:diiron oxygenase [Actinomadura rubrisoli]
MSQFEELLDRLSEKARGDYYNPYTRFDWPASVPEDEWWMSPEFLSVHGTGVEWDEARLKRLAGRETVNFFSLNVHGIRELMIEVARRIHTPGFARYSDFLHHFLGEENEHMWFFAEFCDRYGGGVYPELPALPMDGGFPGRWADVAVFARIVIFEEIVDYLNSRMGRDGRLPPILRELNAVHHHDESRHVAFGKQFVKHLFDQAAEDDADGTRRAGLETYLKRYMTYSVNTLYNPRAYRDAGIPEPMAVRRAAMAHPARAAFHSKLLARVDKFFVANQIFASPWGGAGDADDE